MSTTINGDYLAASLNLITGYVRQQQIKNFLMHDFFAGVDAGKSGLKVPYFQNLDYKREINRIYSESKTNGKYWELYDIARSFVMNA